MIELIGKNTKFHEIFVTEIRGGRCLGTGIIADLFRQYQSADVLEYEDNEKAFDELMNIKDDQDVVFCCGSLYLAGILIGSIRRKIQ